MTSKTIYVNNHPYVYRLDHPVTGEFYIGYRSANKKPAHLDLPVYRTSSDEVKERFDEFNWTIIAEFFDADSAYDFEQLLIFEEWKDPLQLNKSCYYGKQRLKNTGHSPETRAKMSAARQGFKFSAESKAKISASHKGKKMSPESIAKRSATNKGKKRKPNSKPVSAETKAKMSASRLGSKRTAETKAKMSAWQKGVKKETTSCPHCGKVGGKSNMKRYHFDNCKIHQVNLLSDHALV